ncbi:MAG: 4-hydroxythreonine-4-phosphate dehydrogenase PdxA [Magnetococcales bacterium]|nr:4-hydroxythreonine-4-phosphate dehydrogenase PdxA [Magnetococcales bacterium]
MAPVAITMGDPAGVGPEIILKAFHARPHRQHRWIYLGDPQVLAWTAQRLKLPFNATEIQQPEQAAHLPPDTLPMLATKAEANMARLAFGQPDPGHAEATVESIRSACLGCRDGTFDAMATPPINKSVLHAAGIHVPGHTELLAQCCEAGPPVMMLAGQGLRVIPLTIHVALHEVPERLTPQRLTTTLEITAQALKIDFGLNKPRIAVAGLNPHAGEEGAFGRQEIDLIAPVCETMRNKLAPDVEIIGPLPADTMFHPKARQAYDVALCMYHDQALIPIKMLAFGDAVNITLGLPIVRTSVDHGTAYNIAGQGIAEHRSLLSALALAETMADNRTRHSQNP